MDFSKLTQEERAKLVISTWGADRLIPKEERSVRTLYSAISRGKRVVILCTDYRQREYKLSHFMKAVIEDLDSIGINVAGQFTVSIKGGYVIHRESGGCLRFICMDREESLLGLRPDLYA